MDFLNKLVAQNYPHNYTVAAPTLDRLPGLKASSFAIAGFSSGAILTNNLCNSDPTLWDGCGSFCGGLPMTPAKPSSIKAIHTWRRLLQKKGNAKDHVFKGKKWYILRQKNDALATPAVIGVQPQYYKKLGANVKYDVKAGTHLMPTLTKFKTSKWEKHLATNLPQNLGYDGAGDFLRHIYKDIKPRVANWQKFGKLKIVSQKKYQFGKKSGLDDKMFLYVPTKCEKGGCRVQFFFHGCIQSYRKVSMLFAKRTGFLEYAASNNIVVVFPQSNDAAHAYCWDNEGWTGPEFTTKKGL